MTPLVLTLLIGIGALLAIWLVTFLLIWSWFKLSERAVLAVMYDKDLTNKKADKYLRRLRLYASVIRVLKVITIEIPFMLPVLLLLLATAYLANL